jgi:hypothetical protein
MSQAGVINGGPSGSIVNSVEGTAPIEVNGVSGVPQTGNVVVSISGNTSGNRVLIQSQTASSSASIIFNTGITGYDVYELEIYGVTTSGASGATFRLQFSSNAGSTWITGSGYNTSGAVTYNGVGGNAQNYNVPGDSGIWLMDSYSDSSTYAFDSSVKLLNLGSSTLYPSVKYLSTGDNANLQYVSAAGNLASAQIVNGIRIITDGGNFATGVFKLYGIVN